MFFFINLVGKKGTKEMGALIWRTEKRGHLKHKWGEQDGKRLAFLWNHKSSTRGPASVWSESRLGLKRDS